MSSYYRQFDTFPPMTGKAPGYPFQQLPAIAERARYLLKGRTDQQIESAVEGIDWVIDEYFRAAKDAEISRLRAILSEPRKWKREPKNTDTDYEYAQQFFELDCDSGEDCWIFLDDMEDDLVIPTRHNTSEVDALKECLNDWANIGGDEFLDEKEHELFAILALWMLADCLHYLADDSSLSEDIDRMLESLSSCLADHGIKGSMVSTRFSMAGDAALKAMEAVCYAKHLKSIARLEDLRSEKEKKQKKEERQKRSLLAEKLNIARHQKRNEVKSLVISEWKMDKSKFPSAEKAGGNYSSWLKDRGFEYEPRTVTGWIRDYAKEIGVKFR